MFYSFGKVKQVLRVTIHKSLLVLQIAFLQCKQMALCKRMIRTQYCSLFWTHVTIFPGTPKSEIMDV